MARTAIEKGSLESAPAARPSARNESRCDAGFLAVEREVFADQADVEAVDAGGDGGVGGENVVGARGVEGFVETQTLVRHQNANAFDGQERRVAFVHVIDGGVESQGFEGAQAADAEDDFLANALVIVAAVELVGDLAMLADGVLRDVAVEQVELHAADSMHQTLRNTSSPLRSTLTKQLAAAIGTHHGRDGERIEIVDRGALPAASHRDRASAGGSRFDTAGRRR